MQSKARQKKSGGAAISPARRSAFDVLLSVERGRGHSDELLRGNVIAEMSTADRNLATTLVLGTLRWQIAIDERIKAFLKKPGARLDSEVRVALRLGAFQLLFLDRVPAHAAIDESVELTKRAGHRFAAGMVNAVLRKLAQEPRRAATEPASAAHPVWMVERWSAFYGPQAAGLICAHGQCQPTQTLRMESPAVEAELADAGLDVAPGALLASARRLMAGDVHSTAAVREGRVWFQDEGSQLIGEIAACAAESSCGSAKSILDLCAAPGGKTLILAQRNPAAQIVACEASAQRLGALRERLAVCGDCIEFRLADAAGLNEVGQFDLALADVPCSGTGTLGRNPEIRHRLGIEDLPRQAERQRALLQAALRAVRPGGIVVYSTCSLEPEENEQVLSTALAENPSVRITPIGSCLETLEKRGILNPGAAERLRSCITPEGALRLLPGVFETDGFFAVTLEKTA